MQNGLNKRSSAFSSVVNSRRSPSSISAWTTQFMIDCADGSNSRASSDGDRPSHKPAAPARPCTPTDAAAECVLP